MVTPKFNLDRKKQPKVHVPKTQHGSIQQYTAWLRQNKKLSYR